MANGMLVIDYRKGDVRTWTDLAISDLSERLEHLLRGVLVLCFIYHETNELLEGDIVFTPTGFAESFMHLCFVVDQAQTCQSGREFQFGQRVGYIAVEMPED